MAFPGLGVNGCWELLGQLLVSEPDEVPVQVSIPAAVSLPSAPHSLGQCSCSVLSGGWVLARVDRGQRDRDRGQRDGDRVLSGSRALWRRDPGEPGGEGAPASGHDPPAVQPAGPAADGALGAEERGRHAAGEAAAADGAGAAAAGAGGVGVRGWGSESLFQGGVSVSVPGRGWGQGLPGSGHQAWGAGKQGRHGWGCARAAGPRLWPLRSPVGGQQVEGHQAPAEPPSGLSGEGKLPRKGE